VHPRRGRGADGGAAHGLRAPRHSRCPWWTYFPSCSMLVSMTLSMAWAGLAASSTLVHSLCLSGTTLLQRAAAAPTQGCKIYLLGVPRDPHGGACRPPCLRSLRRPRRAPRTERGSLVPNCHRTGSPRSMFGWLSSKHTDVEPVGSWEAPRSPAHGQEHRPINACPIPWDLYKLEAGLRPPKCPTALTPSVSADSNVPSQARRHARWLRTHSTMTRTARPGRAHSRCS
jgi:hypothetical protein